MQTIELAKPRIITIQDRNRTYSLTVRPISKNEWLKYFDSIVSTSEYAQNSRVDANDTATGRRELAESVLVDATGYRSDTPLLQIEQWQSKLPTSHLMTVGAVLTSVSRSDVVDDDAIALGRETVFLDATWGADEKGTMTRIKGLRHTFRTPTSEQQRRFSRDASRSVVVGGSRAGKTKWLGAQPVLVELYDELVLAVDGYTFNGEPLGENRDAIVACMDAYHKAAAADTLFTPAPLNVAEDGEK